MKHNAMHGRPALACVHRAALWLVPVLWLALGLLPASAQGVPGVDSPPATERSLLQWLERLHEAGRSRSYVGTFVVSSAHGQMASARIAHVCDGRQQIEHVEALTGPARQTFRRDSEVVTFLPHRRLVVSEQRDSLQVFPQRLRAAHAGIADHYSLRRLGMDRVAGFDADIIQLEPRDAMRFGYRIWSEQRTGLVMRMQTLAADGRVLEQAAFSELRLDAPVRMERLARLMARTEGYRVHRLEPQKTTPEAEGWALRQPVPGFESTGCQRRRVERGMPADTGAADAAGSARSHEGAMQWTFSDGLATVSLFIEPFDRQRHAQEVTHGSGATQLITRRLAGAPAAAVTAATAAPEAASWWLTAVGEVPVATLEAFARGLERRR